MSDDSNDTFVDEQVKYKGHKVMLLVIQKENSQITLIKKLKNTTVPLLWKSIGK